MTTRTSPEPGSKYTLLDRIGIGGMAEVYRGRLSGAEGFAKLVVIKKLLPHYADDPQVVAHFIAEAKLAALLQHENIAQVYDFGDEGGSYFIAMECLFGKDLHSVLRRAKELHDPLSVEHALMIIAKVCEAMEYAHTLRDFQQQPLHIVHRDLSPHNIFITYEGRVKIIDFGIARTDLFDHHTQIGVTKGKIAYMAPEQLAATAAIDHRADIFAIGILLYEMLSGQRLYSGDTGTMLRKCLQGEYDNLRQICPGLHPSLYEIVDKALAKEVGCRYQSCAHLQADIEECLFAINKRPSPQLLEKLLQRLFGEELAQEKRGRRQTLASFEAVEECSSSPRPRKQPATETPEERTVAGVSTIDEASSVLMEPPLVVPISPPQPPAQRPRHTLLLTIATFLGLSLVAGGIAFHELSRDWDDEVVAPQPAAATPTFTAETGLLPSGSKAEGGAGLRQGGDHTVKDMFQAPKDDRYSLLQESFEKKRQRLIADLEEQANEAMRQERLTSPREDCAHWYYRKILTFDAKHQGALEGLQRLAGIYAAQAEEAFKKFHVKEARTYVREGLTIDPNHPQLRDLQRDLTAGKLHIALKGVEKWRAAR
jgi:serine/threonine protein kinase